MKLIGMLSQKPISDIGPYLFPTKPLLLSFRGLHNHFLNEFQTQLEETDPIPSSETQGRLVGATGNKLGKEMKRHRFTSKAVKPYL